MASIAGKQVPKWVVIAALLVAFVIVGQVSRLFSGVSEREPAAAETEKQAPAPTFAAEEVTEASVRAALSDVDVVEVQAQDNLGTDAPDDKIVHVTYKPEGVADQSPRLMLMDLAKVSATVFEKLFANASVTAVDVTAQVPMVYTDGSEKNDAGARIYWDREKADSVDFKQYRENVAESYFWDAYIGAPDFYVHPGVLASLDEADQAKLRK